MKLLMGAVMIGITVVLHAFVCDWVLKFINRHSRPFSGTFGRFWTIATLITAVFTIGAAIMVDIWLWAVLFYVLEGDVLGNFENALYFASSTFTTVGYGDVVLPESWRILSGSTAINGMIIFGWLTAFIFEIMAKLYEGGRVRVREIEKITEETIV
ncbi:MAG TPA: potassium channel family protein [Alphaproteobacteria bacterium]|nr:potassium channel family protein [Alphaproteobacteria bacterium]HNS45473.1 potassium channel family protein [Alphaproteobacteria bacterium]